MIQKQEVEAIKEKMKNLSKEELEKVAGAGESTIFMKCPKCSQIELYYDYDRNNRCYCYCYGCKTRITLLWDTGEWVEGWV